MKKLTLIIAIVLSGMLMMAQEKQITDLDIANALIGQPYDSIQKIADSLGVQIAYDGYQKIFVSANGTTKYYRTKRIQLYKWLSPTKVELLSYGIGEIFIRYRYSLLNHLADFLAYDQPLDTDRVLYDKQQGKNVAHLKLTYIDSN